MPSLYCRAYYNRRTQPSLLHFPCGAFQAVFSQVLFGTCCLPYTKTNDLHKGEDKSPLCRKPERLTSLTLKLAYTFGEGILIPAFQRLLTLKSFCLRVSGGGCSFGDDKRLLVALFFKGHRILDLTVTVKYLLEKPSFKKRNLRLARIYN